MMDNNTTPQIDPEEQMRLTAYARYRDSRFEDNADPIPYSEAWAVIEPYAAMRNAEYVAAIKRMQERIKELEAELERVENQEAELQHLYDECVGVS